jgi:hypothetical protein
MQRRFSIALMLGLLAVAGSTAVRAESIPMERLVNNEGRYSVVLPKDFVHTTSPRPDGGSLQQFRYQWGKGAIDFGIYDFAQLNADHPATDLPVVLKNAQRNVQDRWPGAVVLQESEIQSGQAQGRSFVLSFDQGKRVLTAKIYYINQRLYELMAVTASDEQNSPLVTDVMNSLQVVR